MQLDPALVQPPAFWLLSVSPLLTLLIPPPCSVFLYSRHSGLEAALPRDRGQLWGRGNRMVKMAVWGLSATLGAAVFAVAQTAMDWGPEVLLQLFWCGGGDFRLLYAHIGDSRHTSALQMDLTISNYIKHTYTKMVKTCKSSLLLQHWSQAVGGRLSWCQTGCCYSTTMNICELLVSLRTWVRMCAHTRVYVVVRFWASIPDLIPHVNMDVYLKRSTVIWLTLQKQDLGHWARASVWSDWQQFFLKSQVNQMTTKGKKTPVMMQKTGKRHQMSKEKYRMTIRRCKMSTFVINDIIQRHAKWQWGQRTQNDHIWLHKTQDNPKEIQDRASDYTKEKLTLNDTKWLKQLHWDTKQLQRHVKQLQ